MVSPGTRLPKARTMGSVIEWSPPRHAGRRPLSSSSPTPFSIAANGSSKVKFKSPASQYAPPALRSTPVSVHGFEDGELKATRIIGGAPAGPRNHEELASNGMPRITGVPALAASGRNVIKDFPPARRISVARAYRSDQQRHPILPAESATHSRSSVIL